MRRIPLSMAGLVWVGLFAILLGSCDRTPPEEALRNRIGALKEAIEARDGATVRNALAEDFIGPDGMDRNGARRLAQGLFLRNQQIGVILGPLDIELLGDRATVHCTAALTGGAGGLFPDSGQIYEVTSGWRLEGDDWRLTSIDWKSR